MPEDWRNAWKGPAVVLPLVTLAGLLVTGAFWVKDAEHAEKMQDAQREHIVTNLNSRIEGIEVRITDNINRFNTTMEQINTSRVDGEVAIARLNTTIDVVRKLQAQLQELQINVKVLETRMNEISPNRQANVAATDP